MLLVVFIMFKPMGEKLSNFIQNLDFGRLSSIDLQKLFNWRYLTEVQPTPSFFFEQWIYVFVIVNWLISIIGFKLIANLFAKVRPKERLIKKISFMWFSNSVFLLLYNLIRVGGVRFFSMRLILILILFSYIIILAYGVFYWAFKLPDDIERFNEEKIRDKYMNRKKKR